MYLVMKSCPNVLGDNGAGGPMAQPIVMKINVAKITSTFL